MPKRLVVCCDGTWNTPDEQSGGQACPTNVTKFALGVADTGSDGLEQRVFYERGVGTSRLEHLAGGAFGYGLSRNVLDAYRFVVANFEPGDEIMLFGFSRGAYTARSTAGFIRNAGVLRRENIGQLMNAYALYRGRTDRSHPRSTEAQLFRRTYSFETRIRCVGVWDTVGALGLPLSGIPGAAWFNRRFEFHDVSLSTTVDNAFQALAIDEQRAPFVPTLWTQQPDAGGQRLEQVWFAGVHSDVGGGYPDAALADVALMWMVHRAESCGLTFRPDAFPDTPTTTQAADVPGVRPDPLGPIHDSRTGFYKLLPPNIRQLGVTDPDHERAASSAVTRLHDRPEYHPANLTRYLDADPGHVTDVP